MPVALGIATLPDQLRAKRLGGPLAYMVDLLAAVPSIIYGVWGLYVLAPAIKPCGGVAQRRTSAGCSCSPTGNAIGGRRRHRSSLLASCWR